MGRGIAKWNKHNLQTKIVIFYADNLKKFSILSAQFRTKDSNKNIKGASYRINLQGQKNGPNWKIIYLLKVNQIICLEFSASCTSRLLNYTKHSSERQSITSAKWITYQYIFLELTKIFMNLMHGVHSVKNSLGIIQQFTIVLVPESYMIGYGRGKIILKFPPF